MKPRKRSEEIYAASCRLIPGGVNSPARAFSGLGMIPLIVAKGKGDRIWDVDEKEYIDFCGAWGSLILGHAPERVVQAAKRQIELGSSFGIATEIEQLLAQKILSHLPSIEKIRFVSSGTEATMSALRLARAFTQKNCIVKFDGNYHGHSDGLLVKAGSSVAAMNRRASSLGVPEMVAQQTLSLPFNDLETVQKVLEELDDLAAVIIEPIAGNMGVVPATASFLEMLRELTLKKQALLIFDEVISGFRVGLGGAQALFGIEPDLTCLGKIIGGGFPAAAFGGKSAIMDHLAPLGQVYQAGTLSGNPVAMSAGLETLLALETPGFYQELEEKTASFLGPIEEAIQGKGVIQRVGSMFTLFWGPEKVENFRDLDAIDPPLFQRFFTHLFEQGIYIPPSAYEAWFISSAHTRASLNKAQEIILSFLGFSSQKSCPCACPN